MAKFPYELNATIIMSEKQEQYNNENNTRLVIMNPYIQLNVPFLKTTQNLSVSILTFGLESAKHKRLEFHIINKDSNEILVNSTLKTNLPYIDPDISSLNLNLDLRNVIIEKEGAHIAKLLIDDILIADYTFFVLEKNENQEN